MFHDRVEVFAATNEDAGGRLDKWLTQSLQDAELEVSRSQVQQWIDDGRVTGPKAEVRGSNLVSAGEVYTVRILESAPIEITPEAIPLDIVFEDSHVVVVNKPRGLVVHPAAGHWSGTVLNGLSGRGILLATMGGTGRPGVVHRIDKDTSGLIVFAKTDPAYHKLSEQLRVHSMDRVYLAIAHGVVPHAQVVIDAPIGRDPRNRQRMAVVTGGKPAITRGHVLETFQDYTYLELRLETGRTHQIRVHMAYIGHPLAGDPLYGRSQTLDLAGQALHAHTLGFDHPSTGERMQFHAPLPEDMETVLAQLRQNL